MRVAGRLQRLRSLEVLKGFTGGSSGSGFTLPTGLSQLTALMCLAVSTDYLGAGLLQLTGLRSLMLHRLQVSARPCTMCRLRNSGHHLDWQAGLGRLRRHLMDCGCSVCVQYSCCRHHTGRAA